MFLGHRAANGWQIANEGGHGIVFDTYVWVPDNVASGKQSRSAEFALILTSS